MTADVFERKLAFALVPRDHFSGAPVSEELDISLGSLERAVRAPLGGARQSDGSYRWIDLSSGVHAATVRSPSGRWTSWPPGPVSVTVPLADPNVPVGIDLWPTPRASAPPGVSAVRCRLAGTGALAGVKVVIEGTGAPSLGRFTFSDASGELLYLLPGGPWPLTAAGRLDLTATVTGRSISSIEVVGGGTFGTARFEIPTQREMRVVFHLA